MPELPEVETIRRGLAPKVGGRKISRVEVRLKKQVEHPSPDIFARRLKGRIIRSVGRRSKFLIFEFGDMDLLVHLGMSGQVTYWDHTLTDVEGFVRHSVTGLQKTTGQHAPDKHTHVLIHLEGGDRIQYRDIRQFGFLRLITAEEKDAYGPWQRLGVEPLVKAFTWPAFKKMMKNKRGGAKAMLLSGRPVCGLGNIYADESLYQAGIHPLQKIERLTDDKLRAFHKAIPAVLNKGLKNGGTTLMDFVNAGGERGKNRESLKVYGRGGQPCLKCRKSLEKIQVVQRTTVFCPACQKMR